MVNCALLLKLNYKYHRKYKIDLTQCRRTDSLDIQVRTWCTNTLETLRSPSRRPHIRVLPFRWKKTSQIMFTEYSYSVTYCLELQLA